jgi:hypothetical protein
VRLSNQAAAAAGRSFEGALAETVNGYDKSEFIYRA